MSDDTAWQTTYKVVRVEGRVEDGDLGSYFDTKYEIHDYNGNVHGSYREYSYAKKQARRKYKKLIRLMEKSLMS